MKIWNKIKFPLLVALFTAVIFGLRILCHSWDAMLYILLFPVLLSRDLFDSNWVLVDIFLILILVGCILFTPAPGKLGRFRRFFLRPLLAILVVILASNPMISNAQEYFREQEEKMWEQKEEAFRAEVREFLDEADELILHDHHSQNYSPYFEDARIRCVCGAYHDVIMIDYDTMRIAFLRHDWIDDFHVYQLKQGALSEENTFVQLDAVLPESGNRLITYYPEADLEHRTCALELVLSDGKIYSTADMPEYSWDHIFLDLWGDEDYLFSVGQPHPKYKQ